MPTTLKETIQSNWQLRKGVLTHSGDQKQIPNDNNNSPFIRQDESRVNLTRHANDTISYEKLKFWYFEPSLSVGNLTDTITTINMPALGAAHYAKGDIWAQYGVSEMLASSRVCFQVACNNCLFIHFFIGQTICNKICWRTSV